MPFVVDESFLKKIEEVVASGCSTNKEIADSIGMKHSLFVNLRHGRRKNGAVEKSLIAEAVKKGTDRQPINILPIAERSLLKGIVGHYVEETTTETVTSERFGEQTKTKVHKKYIQANPALLIFTLKNLSRRLDKKGEERWANDTVEIVDKVESNPSEMSDTEREKRIAELRGSIIAKP